MQNHIVLQMLNLIYEFLFDRIDYGSFVESPRHLLRVIFFGETNPKSPYSTRMK